MTYSTSKSLNEAYDIFMKHTIFGGPFPLMDQISANMIYSRDYQVPPIAWHIRQLLQNLFISENFTISQFDYEDKRRIKPALLPSIQCLETP